MAMAARVAFMAATRKRKNEDIPAPAWLTFLSNEVEQIIPDEVTVMNEVAEQERIANEKMAEDRIPVKKVSYKYYAWVVKNYLDSGFTTFEAIVVLHILLVAVTVGVDLTYDEKSKIQSTPASDELKKFIYIVFFESNIIFMIEALVKIFSHGDRPWEYFIGDDAYWNVFDFSVVTFSTISYVVPALPSGVGVILRILRLLRLLSVLQQSEDLMVIIQGLIGGVKAVTYILVLLLLVLYIYAIVAVLFFAKNDPVFYGNILVAMLTLFQISTLTSWSAVAGNSMFGCDRWQVSLYGEYVGEGLPPDPDDPDFKKENTFDTMLGTFPHAECVNPEQHYYLSIIFYSSFTLITGFVVMSLFIGVISVEMFAAVEKFKDEKEAREYKAKLEENAAMAKAESFAFAKSMEEEQKDPRRKSLVSERRTVSMALAEGPSADSTPLAKKVFAAFSETKGNVEQVSFLKRLQKWAIDLEGHKYFEMFITCMIVIVAVQIGLETDGYEIPGGPTIGYCMIVIFTSEVILKLIADGSFRIYWSDNWNRFDFIIVLIGYAEFIPFGGGGDNGSQGVMAVRILRLFRVFRLAKSLPALRAVVQALLAGMSSVLWVVVLLLIINYIFACLGIILFREIDPVAFADVPTTMFTIWRLETLDSWDENLRIAMYGCTKDASGYPRIHDSATIDRYECATDVAYGWLAALYYLALVVIGGLVMPTVLIGIVCISFEESQARLKKEQMDNDKFELIMKRLTNLMPNYVTYERELLVRELFDELDADGGGELDAEELKMLLSYISKKFMGFKLTDEDTVEILKVVDSDQGGVISFSEFFAFIIMIKRLTPNITQLYHKEKAAKQIQCAARTMLAIRRFKARLKRAVSMDKGVLDEEIDTRLDDFEYIKDNAEMVVQRLRSRIEALEIECDAYRAGGPPPPVPGMGGNDDQDYSSGGPTSGEDMAPPPPDPAQELAELKDFLENVNLGDFADTIIYDEGIQSMQTLQSLTPEDFEGVTSAVGMKLGQKARLRSAVRSVNESFGGPPLPPDVDPGAGGAQAQYYEQQEQPRYEEPRYEEPRYEMDNAEPYQQHSQQFRQHDTRSYHTPPPDPTPPYHGTSGHNGYAGDQAGGYDNGYGKANDYNSVQSAPDTGLQHMASQIDRSVERTSQAQNNTDAMINDILSLLGPTAEHAPPPAPAANTNEPIPNLSNRMALASDMGGGYPHHNNQAYQGNSGGGGGVGESAYGAAPRSTRSAPRGVFPSSDTYEDGAGPSGNGNGNTQSAPAARPRTGGRVSTTAPIRRGQTGGPRQTQSTPRAANSAGAGGGYSRSAATSPRASAGSGSSGYQYGGASARGGAQGGSYASGGDGGGGGGGNFRI